MALYEHQFSVDLDVPGAPAPTRTLLIASSPRCGSHMLGHSLAETGRLGVPFEYANRVNLGTWAERTGRAEDDPVAILQGIMGLRTSPNGVFSIKMHYSHLATLGGAERSLESLPDPRVVRVVRHDLLRQAFSYARARQTGVWIEGQTGSGTKAVFDRALVDASLSELARQHAGWESLIARHRLPAMTVAFEDLREDLPAQIRRILEFMGIDPAGVHIPHAAPTKAQSDRREQDPWIALYAAKPPKASGGIGRRVARMLKGARS